MQTIHLQGIGEKPAILAKELKIGDVTVWNYGFTETIIGILKQRKKEYSVSNKEQQYGLYRPKEALQKYACRKDETLSNY